MIEELFQFLRDAFDSPGQALARLWVVFWLWSVVRNWRRRKAAADAQETLETERETEAPARPAAQPKVEPAPAKPARRAPAQPTAQHAHAQLAEQEAERKAAWARWDALIERAEALRLQLAGVPALRWLESIVADDVIAPLHAARTRSRAQTAPGQAEPSATSAVLTLQVIEHALRDRNSAPDPAWLFEVDRIVQACHKPLREHTTAEDLALLGATPLSVRFDPGHELHARGLSAALLLLPLAADSGAPLGDLTATVHALGQRWYRALPSLEEELQAQLGLSPQLRLIDPRQGYDERSAYASFGPWLPALFADLALSLRLGHGYVTALRHHVVDRAAQATHARAHGGFLGPEPPPWLRIHAALIALEALGRREEVKHHRVVLAEAVPDTEHSLMPLADGRYALLPTDYLVAVTEELARAVLAARTDALGGIALTDCSSLVQTREDAREQVSLSHELMRGVLEGKNPAQLACAAWLAWDAGEDPQRVFTRLRNALSPRLSPRKAQVKAQAPHTLTATSAPRSLRAALQDRQTLRRAIVLGAALAPRRAEQRQR